jgi:hypothetical protein
MHARLEDVLREKEKELKLHQKFLSLVDFCREEVFPFSRAPLERHIASLKELIEKLIPEPKDRREELFSGEVFVLLCTLYIHDIAATTRYGWATNSDILSRIESPPRNLFLNNAIGKRLAIPEKALDLVNSLVFSVKIPFEWEITEDSRKAIVRNGRLLGEVFNFAHHLWDIFSGDSSHIVLRRLQNPDLRLRYSEAALTVDSKEGIIFIKCSPEVPYQAHVLERIREYVETLFKRFADNANGRLGFQYREIVWDIDASRDVRSVYLGDPSGRLSQGVEDEVLPRWEEAAEVLDRLFRFGKAIVVGGKDAGKTTVVNRFIMPQLSHGSANVFCAEIWDRPVDQIREAIERASKMPPGGAVDIISTCKRLLPEGACFFIIDGCERLKAVDPDEREKLERFVEFCIDNENVYLLATGDKEDFFEWYQPFKRIGLSAIFELKPLDRVDGQSEPLRAANLAVDLLHEKVECVIASPFVDDLREVLWVLAGDGQEPLKRYRVSDISFDTSMHAERIGVCLKFLGERGLIREQEVLGFAHYALSDRQLRELLRERLGLDRFTERRGLREALRQARENGTFLDGTAVEKVEALKERMMFDGEETGLIIGSMLLLDRDCSAFLEKARKELRSFDTGPTLLLLSRDDPVIRERAIRLLAKAKDETSVNPLIVHLKKETDPQLRRLLVDGFITLGKSRTVVALIKTLTEINDREAKTSAIDQIADLPAVRARKLLIEIAAVEKEPEMIDLIDSHLTKIEEQ